MKAIVSDAFRWSRDEAGAWLSIRTDQAPALAEELNGKRISVKFSEYRLKRSLDANALYWSHLTEMARALGVSNPYLHNMMLRRYGLPETYDDKLVYVVLPDTDESQRKVDEAETYHLKPTSETRTGKDGKVYRTYIMLRGSSSYDSSEMARLIDGLRSEMKEVGL